MSTPGSLSIRGLSIIAAVAVWLAAVAAEATPSRIIFHHGKVFTSDPAHLWAEAVAVEGNKVIAVGSNAAVLALATPDTRRVDLGGRTVVPGFNDAHVHVVVPEGVYVNTPDFVPGPGPTLPEMLALIKQRAALLPTDTWIMGFIGSNIFDDSTANRFALDTVSARHPVVLFAWTGHGTWLNTRAMELLGVAEDEPDPFGGHWERLRNSSVITGVAHEYAEFAIWRKLLSLLSDAQLVAQYQRFASVAVRYGFTSLQDMAAGLTHERALSVLRAADLPIRVRSICMPLSPDEPCELAKDNGGEQTPKVSATGVKWVTDGTPIERNACVSTPYADRPSWLGVFNFLPAPLRSMMEQHREGVPEQHQLLFHSVGDGAIDRVFGALEDTGGAAAWRGRRVRIEHGDLLLASDFARARSLGVIVVQNPTHLALADVLGQRFTPAVHDELGHLKSLLDEGIPLALGTDGIGGVMNPFVDLLLAVMHPVHSEEALTREEAVMAYTRGSAYAEFEEHRKGTLAPGQLADLVVLSQDIFTVPPSKLPQTQSVLTMVNGKVVWTTNELGLSSQEL